MYVYWNKAGAPEAMFADRFPRIHRLIYDKWRIDELYDATVVGMVDALADIFTMADKWIIDGIIAKLTAALTSLVGTILRALQTGRVQAYSASMVIGLAGLGWFLMRPHAELTADDRRLRQTGEVVVSAAPGLGYMYRWEGKGFQPPSPDFTASRELTLRLEPGEKREVKLTVRNAFNQEATETLTLERPKRGGSGIPGVGAIDPGSARPPSLPGGPGGPGAPGGPGGPTTLPAERIPELLRPRGDQ
jgi:NADH-quinone oxidoreductase subunit L